ncbi:MAG TPA: YggT family protein [Stellaceae bacterium]|nr:YggT family protein [Stellaceae bacterium]
MGGFLGPIIEVIVFLLDIYKWVVIISVVMSWLFFLNVANRHNRNVAMIGEFFYRLTEPALRPIRRFLPDLGGVDISPIILLAIIWLLERWLVHVELLVYGL